MTNHQERTLFLHVGFGKTGSSSLQQWCLRHHVALGQRGLIYPLPNGEIGKSGNGHLLLEAMQACDSTPVWLQPQANAVSQYLFSREHLARELSDPQISADFFQYLGSTLGFQRIEVLLFIRHPVEHCFSLWAQKVKAAGETRSLREFSQSYDSLRMVTRLIDSLQPLGCSLRVLNYSKVRRSLLSAFQQWVLASVDSQSRLYLESFFEKLRLESNEAKQYNVTPSLLQTRLQRRLNLLALNQSKYLGFCKWLPSLIQSAGFKRFDDVILDQWEGDVIQLNKRLMGGSNEDACL